VAELFWTVRIREDLAAIGRYIASDSPAYSFVLLRRINEIAERLTSFPLMGRVVPEFEDESIRELIVQNYRIVYVVRGDKLIMTAAVHGAMDLRQSFEHPPWIIP
jgi:toxin ParE1/3/4